MVLSKRNETAWTYFRCTEAQIYFDISASQAQAKSMGFAQSSASEKPVDISSSRHIRQEPRQY